MQDVAAPHDELRPGPGPISDERVAQLVRKTLDTKPTDGTHWSIRKILSQARLSIDGASHLAGIWVEAAPAATFQTFDRSVFR